MYEIINSVIGSSQYELSDILRKIDTIWLQGGIADSQRNELIGLAREKADPKNSYTSLQFRVDSLYQNMAEIAGTIMRPQERFDGTMDMMEPQEEYPEWIQPTGAHDAYCIGDKMTYAAGKTYICKMDSCVWGPDTYPAGWEKVKKEEEGS